MNKFNLDNVVVNGRNVILQNANFNQIQELINLNDINRDEQIDKISKIITDLQNDII